MAAAGVVALGLAAMAGLAVPMSMPFLGAIGTLAAGLGLVGAGDVVVLAASPSSAGSLVVGLALMAGSFFTRGLALTGAEGAAGLLATGGRALFTLNKRK